LFLFLLSSRCLRCRVPKEAVEEEEEEAAERE